MSRASSATLPTGPASLATRDLGLYGVTVFVWGTSWIALKAQLGVVSPEVSTLWRFTAAAAVMWLCAAAARQPLAFGVADHLRLAASGVLMFSSNFVLFLYGGQYLPSGLLAVVFSLASVVNLLLGTLLLGQPIEGRVAVGGVLGAAGVGLLYWPQIAGTGFDPNALVGLAFCVAGTLSFCLGNMVSSMIQRSGVPLLSANAWGMTYGVATLTAFSLARGQPFILEWTARYLGATLYLAVFASVVALPAISRSCVASAPPGPGMRQCCSRWWRSPSRPSRRAIAGPPPLRPAHCWRSWATCSCCAAGGEGSGAVAAAGWGARIRTWESKNR